MSVSETLLFSTVPIVKIAVLFTLKFAKGVIFMLIALITKIIRQGRNFGSDG